MSSAPPPGFAELARKQTTEADVYYGNTYLTSVFVEFDAVEVEIADPHSVVAAVPNVKDAARLTDLLTGPRATNAQFLCSVRVTQNCGRLNPAVADIIFDESRFRLDLFINSTELLLHRLDEQRYLPDSTVDRSYLHNVRVNVSGSGSDERFNIGSESFLANRESRLRTRYGFSDEGFSLYEVTWQQDDKDTETEIGSFRTLGRNIAFVNDLDIVGMRVASSTKRRLDLNRALGTKVYLFLNERSRVDVYRGNELIHSRYYEAGNQQIETAGFPDGAYDIRMQITGHSGDEQQETQFFVRSGMMPPKGEPQYYVEAGALADNQHIGLPELTGDYWLRAGTSRRVRDDLAVDAEMIYAGDKSLLQAGTFVLKKRWHAYTGAMASDSGDLGLTVRGGYRYGAISASFDYREVRANQADLPINQFDLISGSYRQGTATVGFPAGKGRFFLRGRVNKRRSVDENSIGFSYWAPLVSQGKLIANFSLDGNYSRDRSWIQAGVTIRWSGRRDSAMFTPRVQYRDELGGGDTHMLAQGRWNATTQLPLVGQADRSYYFNHDTDRSSIGAQFVPRDLPLADFEVGLQRNQQRADVYYAMNNSFSVVSRQGRTTWGEGGKAAGAVIINVQGEFVGKFAVLVDNRVVGHAWTGTPTVISLRPYETYAVRIVPVGNKIVGFDQGVREVTLYPGNVEALDFTAHELTVLVGQLVFANGQPVVDAKFLNVEGFGSTDDQGWFQVEVGHHAPLQLQLADQSLCVVQVPDVYVDQGLAVLDTLVCETTPGPQ